MTSHQFHTVKYFDKIMESFLEYIVMLTIYYRNGGKIRELNLTSEIGYVPLGQSIYSNVRGFKFLEKYCTTLSFSEQEFVRVVALLRQEYEEEEKRIAKSKYGLAKAYGELTYWWEKEDNEVSNLIALLRNEIEQDKYLFSSYQDIIGRLLVLEYWGHNIGNIDEWISLMNQNIDNSEDVVDIERQSFSVKNNPELKKRYDEYVDRLKLNAGHKNYVIKANELFQYMNSDNWAEELLNYCDKHYNEFLCRYGFIDLLDIDNLLKKMQNASVMELCLIKDIFIRVYSIANISDFFSNDLDIIKKFRDSVKLIDFDGINKPLARKELENCLDDIIKALKKDANI